MRALAFLLSISVCSVAYAQDQDHPLLKAYPGSYIASKEAKGFNEMTVAVAPPAAKGQKARTARLEGNITTIDYRGPDTRSSLEIIRNYETALSGAGFEIVYQCANADACAEQLDDATMSFYAPQRYLNAKLARPQGDVWVRLRVNDGPFTTVDIIEMTPMDVGMVKVNADALAGDITSKGHVAVYGIYFDTARADLKPESADALKEISALLQKNPKLKIHVVGHTDNAGALAANMDLSRKRADSVVKALTTTYKVGAARLRSDGVGPLSPVESNASEEGRARNRRVELVAQ
ncbi:MAG: OmpA family protein [Thioalkalivibrio sp.]|nr:OmpA family protein [Thioalkalivibrio sp.]